MENWPGSDPDQAQILIDSSLAQASPTNRFSWKSVREFLSNFVIRETDKQKWKHNLVLRRR